MGDFLFTKNRVKKSGFQVVEKMFKSCWVEKESLKSSDKLIKSQELVDALYCISHHIEK